MSEPQIVPIPLGFVHAFIIIQDKQAVLVDTGLGRSVTRILRAVAKAAITPQQIKLIILTHGHTDHTGSARELREICGAPIALHALDLPFLTTGSNGSLRSSRALGRMIARASTLESRFRPMTLQPDLLVPDGFDLAGYGIEAHVVHTPGHTPGSISIVTLAGDALIGDLLLKMPFKFGQPTVPFFIDDAEALNASISRILGLNPVKLYSAHGGYLRTETVRRWFATYAG